MFVGKRLGVFESSIFREYIIDFSIGGILDIVSVGQKCFGVLGKVFYDSGEVLGYIVGSFGVLQLILGAWYGFLLLIGFYKELYKENCNQDNGEVEKQFSFLFYFQSGWVRIEGGFLRVY